MKTLFILNDAPHVSERTYNGLRFAVALSRQEGNEVYVFLIGDGVTAAKKGHEVPQGSDILETMIASLVLHDVKIGVCGTCMDARGLTAVNIVNGTQRSTLADLAEWTAWADKVLVF